MKARDKKVIEKINLLRKEIEEHNRKYYVENNPVISDFEYDMLMEELASLERAYPELSNVNSPTNRVGSDISTSEKLQFVQTEHRSPMLSLSNTYEKEEILSFNDRIVKLLNDEVEYVCELKIDGSAISLTYSNGELVRAVTRGDGNRGDDITRNVLEIPSIPSKLAGSGYPGFFEIRGEIFMPWDSFNKLNEERFSFEEELFANPRNAAAGSLKLLDPSEVSKRGLESILYHLISEDIPVKTHAEMLKSAAGWGLPVSPHTRICKSVNEIFNYLDYWDEKRKELPYPTDGVVIKVNNLEQQKRLGFTAKSPRWATAFKFKAERALTRIISLDYQVGRTGAVTPVANLAPVLLSGTMVKRASLHNHDQIQLLDLHINDYVYVEKGGEIIPKIVSVEPSMRSADPIHISFPEFCPDCGTRLVKREEEAKHYCPNTKGCPTQIKAALLHFTGRKAMDILAGEATIEQLFQKGFIRRPSDFYKLSKENLLELEGWKEKSAQRFLQSLERSKSTPFSKVLFALGIRYIGETTAKNLASHFINIDNLIAASPEELLEVEEVGEILVGSLSEYFADPENISLVRELESFGIRMEEEKKAPLNGTLPLAGLTFVVSGVFSVSRDQIKSDIERNGGKVTSAVSQKTSFLIAGDAPGENKIKQAGKLNVKIISEREFEMMIRQSVD